MKQLKISKVAVSNMIDEEGFRPNVGIIITNDAGQLFWGKRVGQDAWQFPQGGVNEGETALQALNREIYEEVGLKPEDFEVLRETKEWLPYRLPKRLVRKENPVCIGQKQKWFLLRLKPGSEKNINFTRGHKAEFDQWRWVNYWYPLRMVVNFKKEVYRQALIELMHPASFNKDITRGLSCFKITD